MTDNIPPEVMAQLLRQGGIEKRNQLIEQQLAEAQAMGQQQAEHSTGLGAALGGIGTILDRGVGAYRGKQLRGQQSANLDEIDAGRQAVGTAFADAEDPARLQPAAQEILGQSLSPSATVEHLRSPCADAQCASHGYGVMSPIANTFGSLVRIIVSMAMVFFGPS